MPGGLMNIIAYGNLNVILNGNPKRSFFMASYKKYTNFGLQKFRIEHEGLRQLDPTKETHYTFKMPRYGDLLMDTYLAIKLPNIWSPVYKRTAIVEENGEQIEKFTYIPYEFKWIEEIGTQMIKEIRVRCGNTTLQQYSGEYISIVAKRDYSGQKLNVFNEMTGNTPLLNNPTLPYTKVNPALNAGVIVGYPSAFFDKTSLQGGGPEPSIRGRYLYIPLNAWFCNNSEQPFPMVASQYSELFIDITLRPLKDLFVIRDVSNYYNGSQDNLSYTAYDNVLNEETEEFIKNPNGNNENTTITKMINKTFLNGGIISEEIINYNKITMVINYKINFVYNYKANYENIQEVLKEFTTESMRDFIRIDKYTTNIGGINQYEEIVKKFENMLSVQVTFYNVEGNNLLSMDENFYNINEDGTIEFINKITTYNYINNVNINSKNIITRSRNIRIAGRNVNIGMIGENNKTETFNPPIINSSIEYYNIHEDKANNIRDNNNMSVSFLNDYPHIAPNFNLSEHALYRFLHPPPNTNYDYTNADKRIDFNSDIHLVSTYGFLSEEENRQLSQYEQSYLIKDVREYTIQDIVGTQKVELESTGLINNWTFFMRRSDVDIRNEWNNYTNWRYKYLKPQLILNSQTINNLYIQEGQLYDPAIIGTNVFYNDGNLFLNDPNFIRPPLDYFSSGPFNIENDKSILKSLEILLDGKIRESKFDIGVFQYIEPFMRTSGGYEEGLHVYNFGLKTNPYSLQPNGAINLSKFSKIELEIETELPPLDPDAEFNVVCANVDGTNTTNNNGNQIIGVNKEEFRLYKYTYDMRVFEEKYNVVTFVAGHCGLMTAR
jgi:hypothetical protein